MKQSLPARLCLCSAKRHKSQKIISSGQQEFERTRDVVSSQHQ